MRNTKWSNFCCKIKFGANETTLEGIQIWVRSKQNKEQAKFKLQTIMDIEAKDIQGHEANFTYMEYKQILIRTGSDINSFLMLECTHIPICPCFQVVVCVFVKGILGVVAEA